MLNRGAAFLLLLALPVGAENTRSLQQEPTSARARRLRDKAIALFTRGETVQLKLQAGKPVAEADLRDALANLDDAIRTFEKALRIEWNGEANRAQARAVRAWYQVGKELPPPPAPKTAEEREKHEKRLRKERAARKGTVRKIVLQRGSMSSHRKMLPSCRRCDGRGKLRSSFGDPPIPCPTCRGEAVRLSRRALLATRWYVYSPLYRDDGRNVGRMEALLHLAAAAPEQLKPFVKRVSIRAVEDHDLYIRIHTREKLHDKAKGKSRTEEKSYVFYRAGATWFLWDKRVDLKVLDIPALERKELEEAEKAQGGS